MKRGWVVSSDYRALIEALSLFRQKAGISQRELARRVGKPPSFINKIELFERRLDILEFIVISEALEQSSDSLIKFLRSSLSDEIQIP